MSRISFLPLLATLALAFVNPGSGRAQEPPPAVIEAVDLGFPGVNKDGNDSGRRCRIGAWNPVQIRIRADRALAVGDLEIILETADADDVQGQYSVSLPALNAGQTRTVQSYVRPGNRTARVSILLRDRAGKNVQTLERTPEFGEVLLPQDVFYLTLGARLPGLSKALKSGRDEKTAEEGRGDRAFAHLSSVSQMPDRWIGYDGVDVVVLSTGSGVLVELLDARGAAARSALSEWLRRGGKLVLSTGSNFHQAQKLLELLGVKELTLERAEKRRLLLELQRWVNYLQDPFPGGSGIDVARVLPTAPALSVVTEPAMRAGEKPSAAIAEVTVGLGRLVLVAFDLESPVFAEWKGHSRFWEKLHGEVGPKPPVARKDRPDLEGRPAELGTEFQRALENFEEVPAVSFGWIALFILLYILIVGPLDYLFLKKVVKKMEWTWITFPVVVLVVSVAAYFTAYSVKGRELRIKKVDVIDMDLRTGAVQAHTTVTLFSPRVQAYTIGVEPSPEWLELSGAGRAGYNPVLGPLNASDASAGGVDRPGSQALFRRPYRYAEDASGLRQVPIPVWAARSFLASWRAQVPVETLKFRADFSAARDDPARLVGSLSNGLPAELREVAIFYKGRWYTVPNGLAAGERQRIESLGINATEAVNSAQWLADPFRNPGDAEKPRAGGVPQVRALMKSLLFHSHESDPNSHKNNAGLRRLDHGWRLRAVQASGAGADLIYRDEAVIVARAVLPTGPAEQVNTAGISASRLWLGRLPGDGDRPALQGAMTQETYLRLYVPIQRQR